MNFCCTTEESHQNRLLYPRMGSALSSINDTADDGESKTMTSGSRARSVSQRSLGGFQSNKRCGQSENRKEVDCPSIVCVYVQLYSFSETSVLMLRTHCSEGVPVLPVFYLTAAILDLRICKLQITDSQLTI
ncbi:hypothetical protein SRHO_G00140650 [Serrasalmus rhombeus]